MSVHGVKTSSKCAQLTWCPPIGEGFIVQPPLGELEAAIMQRGSEFWSAGSQDGGLYFDVDSSAASELYLAFSEIGAFFVLHTDCSTGEQRVLTSDALFTERVVPYPGGNPWWLPGTFFVDRATAWRAVQQFYVDGSRAPEVSWAPFEFPELEP